MFRNLFAPAQSTTGVAVVRPKELQQRIADREKLVLLDVRSSDEYAHDGHIAGSRLIPLPALSARLDELPKDTPIVCICRSGSRSQVAAELLVRQGFSDVANLAGGMIGWQQAGLPAKRG
jgi:rhodanese-related sulfurtransferase